MSQQERYAHREEIVSDVEAFLISSYYAPELEMRAKSDAGATDEAKRKARILTDWADALEDWTITQVLWGLRKWRDDNPSKKPNPSHIKALLKAQRGKVEAAKMPKHKEPEKEPRISKERAAEIMNEIGFKVKRIEGDG